MSLPALVLIPGLMCDGGAWVAQREALRARGFDVSVASHGAFDSLPAMASAILAAHAGPLLVVGHSMGGRVALEIARQDGARLRGAALLDTGFRARPQDGGGERERQGRLKLLEQARAQGIRPMALTWLRGMVHPSRLEDTELIEAIVSMFERRSVSEFAAQIRALLQRPDATGLLPQIACPTLLLCGEQDQWSPPAQHMEMQQLIAGSRLVLIPEAGHMSTMEQPQAVNAALLAWLDGLNF